jgi:hypothetical protein
MAALPLTFMNGRNGPTRVHDMDTSSTLQRVTQAQAQALARLPRLQRLPGRALAADRVN